MEPRDLSILQRIYSKVKFSFRIPINYFSNPQYMASALLLQPNPANILIIGIGAGSLIQFFTHHFPDCTIDGVDNSPLIIDLARAYFGLRETKHTTLHCQDGFDFLSRKKKKRKYDIICIDAFDERGMAKKIYSRDFFSRCAKSLAPGGVLSLNLWSGNDKLLQKVKKGLHHEFDGRLFLPVKKRENVVGLAFEGPPPWEKIDRTRHELSSLSKKYGINLKEIVTVARKHNMKLGDRLSTWLK